MNPRQDEVHIIEGPASSNSLDGVWSLNPDRPIEQEHEESLDRVDFAKQLAALLMIQKRAPSITIGLEGAWGSGKTSCLNLVRTSIEASGKAIFVQYSPWLVSTVDSLISGFFVQIATGIGQRTTATGLQKVARQMLKFGTLIQPAKLVPGVEPWGTVAEKILESGGRLIADQDHFADWDIVKQKENLETELDNLEKSVVVLLDDLDRLPPDQICEVLQLIKAIGSFRNVSYLVAYDREIVCHAINEVHKVVGERFLEKMMTIAIPLPRFSQYRKLELLQVRLQTVIHGLSVELTASEQLQLDWLFNGVGIHFLVDTPRDICRLENRVACRLLGFKDEIDFADLVGIELLTMKYPQLAKLISRRWDEFVSASYTDREVVPDGMEQQYIMWQISGVPDQSIESLSENHATELGATCIEILQEVSVSVVVRESYTRLLEFLFPGLIGHTIEGQPVYNSAKRLCTRNGMLLWLHGGKSPITRDVSDCREFLLREKKRRIILDGWMDEDVLVCKLNFCASEIPNLTVADREGLCKLLVERCPSEDCDSVVSFLIAVLRSVGSEKTREPILNTIVSSPAGLDVSMNVLMLLLTAAGISIDGRFYKRGEECPANRNAKLLLSREKLYKLAEVWLDTVRREVQSETFLDRTKNPAGVLCTWGHLSENGLKEVHSFVKAKCSDAKWVQRFVSKLNPKSPLPNCVHGDFIQVLEGFSGSCAVCARFLKEYTGGEHSFAMD